LYHAGRLPYIAVVSALFCILASQVSANGKLAVKWDGSTEGTAIDLNGHQVLFNEDFDTKALEGPKVFAPVHAPFGAGTFDAPAGEAYDVSEGTLILKAYKQDNAWRSGSVQTADLAQSSGRTEFDGTRGFACADCYFETRLKFPKGVVHGLWAGFWLLSPEAANGHTEIDVLEWYGGDPKGHHKSVHVWPKDRHLHAFKSDYTGMSAIIDGNWHTYGAQIRDGTVYIYTDRKEVAKVAVSEEFKTSYYALVTLAVLPKEAKVAEAPFSIAVDYIRAYAAPAGATE